MAFEISAAEAADGEAVLPLALAKRHLRVDGDDDDALIEMLRAAAIGWVERHTSKALTARAFTWSGDCFPVRGSLARGPVSAVASVGYLDSAGTAQVLAGGAWRLAGGALLPLAGACWPYALGGAGAVTVAFTAGYADVNAQAPELVTAVAMLLGHLYAQREAIVVGDTAIEVPFGVLEMCRAYREVRL